MENKITYKVIRVALPIALDQTFDYLVPIEHTEPVRVGELVFVPFANIKYVGVVWEVFDSPSNEITVGNRKYKLKNIEKHYNVTVINQKLRKLVEFVASYTMSSIGLVSKMIIENEALSKLDLIEKSILLEEKNIYDVRIRDITLTPKRKQIIDVLNSLSQQFKAKNFITIKNLSQKSNISPNIIKSLIDRKILRSFDYYPYRANFIDSKITYKSLLPSFNDEQQKVINYLAKKLDISDISDQSTVDNYDIDKKKPSSLPSVQNNSKENNFSVTLIEGVTGSGKTEVYFSLINDILSKTSGQILILLPEIILTQEINQRFNKRFGFYATEWNSEVSKSKKSEIWLNILNGKEKVIIGARSALFLPFVNLKLIIIDEEHEHSFKQEDNVIYQARDIAILRAKYEKIPIILGSATPSIESLVNVKQGKYDYIKLTNRFGQATLPQVQAINMKEENLEINKWIANSLKEQIIKTVESGNQALLFLNRRGYAPLMLCRQCGYRFNCPNCSSWLVEHKTGYLKLMCHHCGYGIHGNIQCKQCASDKHLASCGPGVERIEDELKEYFPNYKIITITSDNVNNKSEAVEIFSKIKENYYNIIVGTQIIAKGHHFPNLTLIGVIDADLGLKGGDLRAAEKTYQLLHQVGGRAGREKDKGMVFLQTYFPEEMVIQSLVNNKHQEFLEYEIEARKECNMPPYANLAALIIHGANEEKTKNVAFNIVRKAPEINEVEILGPSKAPIYLLRNKYRYRILIICPKSKNIQKIIKYMLDNTEISKTVKVKIDINPYNFM